MFHVKQQSYLNDLFSFLRDQRIDLDERQENQIIEYVSLLQAWGQRQNLISKNDLPYIAERHLLPSLYYLYVALTSGEVKTERIVDIGTGAGLPGIVFSVYFNDGRVTLVDSSRKKMLFLKEVKRRLGLNVELLLGRVEEVAPLQAFTLITARAVASLKDLIRLARPLVAADGVLLTMKGQQEVVASNTMPGGKIGIFNINGVWQNFSDYLHGKTMVMVEFK